MLDGQQPMETQVGGNHYKDMVIQPSEFITRNNLNWCEGNAIKYICRHSIKNGAQDIDKAIHYLQLLKEIEYAEQEEHLSEVHWLAEEEAQQQSAHEAPSYEEGKQSEQTLWV